MPLRRHGLVTSSLLLLACATDRPASPLPPAALDAEVAAAADITPATIGLTRVGGFNGGGPAAAEIPAYDATTKRVFVVNGALGTVDVLSLREPSRPSRVATISVSALGASANSVAVSDGLVAVAIEASTRTDPGTVAFYRAGTLDLVAAVTVGALPDMVTFTPDGRTVLVANEGEPNDPYTIDPEGSISVIDVTERERPVVRTARFGAWDGQEAALRAQGIRIFGPNATTSQDLEPEYIAVAPDGRTAWVTLQENNALAIVDIATATVSRLVPLGYKDHNVVGRGLDASDRDGVVNIRPWPVLGMYQPDGIAAYAVGGQTWLVTANEGDARAYGGFTEDARVGANLDATIFTPTLCGGSCTGNANLARLTVTQALGFDATAGTYSALYAFGARSFSIRTADGRLVWDSGDEFEQRTQALGTVPFNASNDNANFDDRSDNKGPEPEGVVVGRLGTKYYAFIGLERVGGVMVYDVTTPTAPVFVTYANPRQGTTGDLGPEGLVFVPPSAAPGGRPLLIVGNEVSGTTAIYRIDLK